MRRGGRLFIILGVGLALVAVALVVMTLSNGSKKSPPVQVTQVTSVPVLQAVRDLPANTVITQDDVKSVQVERSAASTGAAQSASQVIGLATNGDVVKGQQILMANLVTPGLTNLLTNGKRAAALPVDRVSALGGLIRADDYVDIVYSIRLNLTTVLPTSPVASQLAPAQYTVDPKTMEVPPSSQGAAAGSYPYAGEPGSTFSVTDDQNGNPVTKVIVQNVRVLRVIAGNQSVNDSSVVTPTPTPTTGPSGASGTATSSNAVAPLPSADMLVLEVDPQQAELIKFLQDNQGKYQVVLRAPDDHATATTTGVTYDQLISGFGLPAPKPVKLPGGGQ
ncbi:MAG TPA: Flp pilus assembly protein CpaB [Nitrolancea sp.]|nr:Flp pilus assembly protein CpaB [Nitrolancea sp.]